MITVPDRLLTDEQKRQLLLEQCFLELVILLSPDSDRYKCEAHLGDSGNFVETRLSLIGEKDQAVNSRIIIPSTKFDIIRSWRVAMQVAERLSAEEAARRLSEVPEAIEV